MFGGQASQAIKVPRNIPWTRVRPQPRICATIISPPAHYCVSAQMTNCISWDLNWDGHMFNFTINRLKSTGTPTLLFNCAIESITRTNRALTNHHLIFSTSRVQQRILFYFNIAEILKSQNSRLNCKREFRTRNYIYNSPSSNAVLLRRERIIGSLFFSLVN